MTTPWREEPCDPASEADGGPIGFTPEGVPEWVDRSFPLFFIGLGLVSIVGLVASSGDQPMFASVALTLVAIAPWALSLVGVRVPDPLFAAWVIVPVGTLVALGESSVGDAQGGGAQISLMLVIGVVGQMAAIGSGRLVVGVTIAGLVAVVPGAVISGQPLDFTPWVVGILLGGAGGRAFRNSMVSLAQLRRAQLELAEQQVADERRRIVREVHDIVAHTMSVTMLHLTAARLALDSDPDAAREALLAAEESGRSSMDDIRGVVRLLRTDETAVDAALPADADLPALVDRYRSAGGRIDFELTGDLSTVAPASRLGVYRIVQESISNAVRHGDGPVRVVVRVGREVEIDVTNTAEPGAEVGNGTGLTGMRERVEALGGRFAAGLDDDGRWRVHAEIPDTVRSAGVDDGEEFGSTDVGDGAGPAGRGADDRDGAPQRADEDAVRP